MRVEGDTADLYRFFDATAFAEYLYDRIAETIRRDLRDELGFVAVFTRASEAAREIVDMPDRRLSLFVRLVMQNQDGSRRGNVASSKSSVTRRSLLWSRPSPAPARKRPERLRSSRR